MNQRAKCPRQLQRKERPDLKARESVILIILEPALKALRCDLENGSQASEQLRCCIQASCLERVRGHHRGGIAIREALARVGSEKIGERGRWLS